MTRVRRSRWDLWQALQEQVDLLTDACVSFDRGREIAGKHISLNLRVLLHDSRASHSLLRMLGLRDKRFMDSTGDLNPRNLLTDCALCVTAVGDSGAKFEPLCAAGGGPFTPRWVPFDKWWNASVIKDNKGRHLKRREIILSVANTDGGAHVDETLDEKYMDLSRLNSLGWVLQSGDVRQALPSPAMACLRQLAHEVLETLKVKARDKLRFVYEPVQSNPSIQMHGAEITIVDP